MMRSLRIHGSYITSMGGEIGEKVLVDSMRRCLCNRSINQRGLNLDRVELFIVMQSSSFIN